MMQLDDIIFFVSGILCGILLEFALGLTYGLRYRVWRKFVKRRLNQSSSDLEFYVDELSLTTLGNQKTPDSREKTGTI